MYRSATLTFGVAVLLALPAGAAAQPEQVQYYGLDAIGSVRIVFDPAGTILGRVDFMPFGEDFTSVKKVPNERFAGLARDGEAGFDYAEARLFQPRSGRFTAADPIYDGLFTPQAWNRYAYALNNPLRYVDPSGLTAFLVDCNHPDPGYRVEFGRACKGDLFGGGADDGMIALDDVHNHGGDGGIAQPPVPPPVPVPPPAPPPPGATNTDVPDGRPDENPSDMERCYTKWRSRLWSDTLHRVAERSRWLKLLKSCHLFH